MRAPGRARARRSRAESLRGRIADNPQADLIRRKGEEHEAAYLASLCTPGRHIVEPCDDADAERLDSGGASHVIYQPVFHAPAGWTGRADFLELQPDGGYDVVDTKLARHAKPYYILQLCFYTEQVARIQGHAPRLMHVVLGSGERVSFRPEEFGAYYRRVRRTARGVRRRSAAAPSLGPSTHCAICDFRPLCEAHWDRVDHLSRVAGIRRTQIDKLAVAGIATLAALGRAPTERAAGISARHVRQDSRAGGAPALRARARRGQVRPRSSRRRSSASRSCPTPRRATSSSTSRATRSGTRAARSKYLWGSSTSTATSLRSTRTTTRPSGSRSRRSSTSSTSGSRVTRHARLPLRGLRDHRAHAASWAATARARRSSTTSSAAASSSTC